MKRFCLKSELVRRLIPVLLVPIILCSNFATIKAVAEDGDTAIVTSDVEPNQNGDGGNADSTDNSNSNNNNDAASTGAGDVYGDDYSDVSLDQLISASLVADPSAAGSTVDLGDPSSSASSASTEGGAAASSASSEASAAASSASTEAGAAASSSSTEVVEPTASIDSLSYTVLVDGAEVQGNNGKFEVPYGKKIEVKITANVTCEEGASITSIVAKFDGHDDVELTGSGSGEYKCSAILEGKDCYSVKGIFFAYEVEEEAYNEFKPFSPKGKITVRQPQPVISETTCVVTVDGEKLTPSKDGSNDLYVVGKDSHVQLDISAKITCEEGAVISSVEAYVTKVGAITLSADGEGVYSNSFCFLDPDEYTVESITVNYLVGDNDRTKKRGFFT